MASRARISRFLGGITMVAGALFVAIPGQAFAATAEPVPSPAPAVPLQEPPLSTPPLEAPPLARPAPAQETPPLPPIARPTAAAAPGQVAVVPTGPADTGGGSTSPTDGAAIAIGALGLAAAAGVGGVAVSRRRRDTTRG